MQSKLRISRAAWPPAAAPRSPAETGLIYESDLLSHPAVVSTGGRLVAAPHTIEPASTAVFSRRAIARVCRAHRAGGAAAGMVTELGSRTSRP
jgi:hypothetical protein